MRVCLEIGFPPTSIRNVGVQLGGREIGMTEHLLNTSEVGAALEQVRGERVPQQVGMDPLGLEPRLRRQPAQDQECTGPRERPTLGVEEELRPVSAVEIGPPSGKVAP
jgi:hypothetical protein